MIIWQIAAALQYAHDHKLIHCDVKPDNCLLLADGSLALSDFGIAILQHSTSYTSQHSGRTPLDAWQKSADGKRSLVVLHKELNQGPERWIVVRSTEGVQRALHTARKQADKQLESWTKKLWQVSAKSFACQEDAQAAWKESLKGLPEWLDVSMELTPSGRL